MLIPAWVITMATAAAIHVQWRQRRYEHVFPRCLLFALYFGLTLFPNIPIETARFYNRYFLLILLFTEALSFYFHRRGRR